MNGAIFYASKYGSTAKYAAWIGEATGLPAFDVDEDGPSPAEYDFVVLGSPILYFGLKIRTWAKRNLTALLERPVILFSVSGAGAGPRLDQWLAKSLPSELVSHLDHFALRGRQIPDELTWFDRSMLIVAGLKNRGTEVGKQEMHGFDFMEKSSIGPVVDKIRRVQGAQAAAQ